MWKGKRGVRGFNTFEGAARARPCGRANAHAAERLPRTGEHTPAQRSGHSCSRPHALFKGIVVAVLLHQRQPAGQVEYFGEERNLKRGHAQRDRITQHPTQRACRVTNSRTKASGCHPPCTALHCTALHCAPDSAPAPAQGNEKMFQSPTTAFSAQPPSPDRTLRCKKPSSPAARTPRTRRRTARSRGSAHETQPQVHTQPPSY